VLGTGGADGIAGPVNLTGPEPVTNREFTKALGRVLHRPVVLPPVPRVALRLAIGEFADVGVVAGQRVLPRVLQQTGYRFRHETVDQALRWATGGGR
jgi:NAD dependent epimerase/dehydratase family enzyme